MGVLLRVPLLLLCWSGASCQPDNKLIWDTEDDGQWLSVGARVDSATTIEFSAGLSTFVFVEMGDVSAVVMVKAAILCTLRFTVVDATFD